MPDAFWRGDLGRALRRESPWVRIVASYLTTAPTAVATGLYYLPLPLLAHDIGCNVEIAKEAVAVLVRLDFCQYDAEEEIVWVFDTARAEFGEAIEPGGHRVGCIRALLQPYLHTRLGREWLAKHGRAYHCAQVSS